MEEIKRETNQNDVGRSSRHRRSNYNSSKRSRAKSLIEKYGYDGTVLIRQALYGPYERLTSCYGFFDMIPERRYEVSVACHQPTKSSSCQHLISGRVDYSPQSLASLTTGRNMRVEFKKEKPKADQKDTGQRGEPAQDTVALAQKEREKHEPADVEISLCDEKDLHVHRRLCSCHNNNQQVPISRFKLNPLRFLPPSYKLDYVVDFLLALAGTVVQVSVRYISPNRPEVFWDSGPSFPRYLGLNTNALRTGSGMLSHVDLFPKPYGSFRGAPSSKCDCDTCKANGNTDITTFASFYILTAAHSVFDDFEAKRTTVNFFFDTDQTLRHCPGVQSLGGLRVKMLKLKEDRIVLKYSTHEPVELKLARKLEILCKQRDDLSKELRNLQMEANSNVNKSKMKNAPLVIMVSHPHGCSKTISFGQRIPSGDPDTLTHTAASCPGSSGAPLVCDLGLRDFSITALHSGYKREENLRFSLSTKPLL